MTAIGTDRHLYPGIDQAEITPICSRLYPFIDEIEIDLDSPAQSSLSQMDNSLNTGMRRGCG
jgi:hypothetical protein